MGMVCSLSGDIAVCTVADASTTEVATMTIDLIEVQAGTTATAVPTAGGSGPDSAVPSDSSSRSGIPGGASQSARGSAQSPSPSANSASTRSLVPYLSVLVGSAAMMAVML